MFTSKMSDCSLLLILFVLMAYNLVYGNLHLPQYVCHQEYIQTNDFQFVRNKSTINANLSFIWGLCLSLSCQIHMHALVLPNRDLTHH